MLTLVFRPRGFIVPSLLQAAICFSRGAGARNRYQEFYTFNLFS